MRVCVRTRVCACGDMCERMGARAHTSLVFSRRSTAWRADISAAAAGGRVFREEDLAELPALLEGRTSQVSSLKRLELAYSPVLLGWLLLCACAEWLVRRLHRLK